ncbi:MAG: sigma-70 family RNA polymerase sigma factor [Puia sp.]|nr:sigma-70 family RNA polymerase sigma factor [Puia sp.]
MRRDKTPEAALTVVQPVNPHKWVETYADYLYTYALVRINDEELAKDLVQETFLGALQRVDKFEGKSTERTWLTAILKNKIIDVYRKRSSGLANLPDEQNGLKEQHDFFNPADGHWTEAYEPQYFGIEDRDPVLNKELNGILKKCMQRLPALWLAVFTMKHMEDHSTDIICSELKVTPSNFWVIIHRAKVNLRECLQRNWL